MKETSFLDRPIVPILLVVAFVAFGAICDLSVSASTMSEDEQGQVAAEKAKVCEAINPGEAVLFATSNEQIVKFLAWHQHAFPDVPRDRPMTAEERKRGSVAYVLSTTEIYAAFTKWKAKRK